MSQLKNKARREEQRENWSRAIEFYTQALDASRSDGEAFADLSLYNRIGDIYLRIGQKNTAVRYYEQAIDRYADQDLHTSAIALCNKVLRILPERSTVFLQLGRLHLETNLIADARAHFHRYADAMRDRGGPGAGYEALEELIERTGDVLTLKKWMSWLAEEEDGEAAEARVEAAREMLEDQEIDVAEVLDRVRTGDVGELELSQVGPADVDPLARAFLSVPEEWEGDPGSHAAGSPASERGELPTGEEALPGDAAGLASDADEPPESWDELPFLTDLGHEDGTPGAASPEDGRETGPSETPGSKAEAFETEDGPGSLPWDEELDDLFADGPEAPPLGEAASGTEMPELHPEEVTADVDASPSGDRPSQPDEVEWDVEPAASGEDLGPRTEAAEADAAERGRVQRPAATPEQAEKETDGEGVAPAEVSYEEPESALPGGGTELEDSPPRTDEPERSAPADRKLRNTVLASLELEAPVVSTTTPSDGGGMREGPEPGGAGRDAGLHAPPFDPLEHADAEAFGGGWSGSFESPEAGERPPSPGETGPVHPESVEAENEGPADQDEWHAGALEAIDRLTAPVERDEGTTSLEAPEPDRSERSAGSEEADAAPLEGREASEPVAPPAAEAAGPGLPAEAESGPAAAESGPAAAESGPAAAGAEPRAPRSESDEPLEVEAADVLLDALNEAASSGEPARGAETEAEAAAEPPAAEPTALEPEPELPAAEPTAPEPEPPAAEPTAPEPESELPAAADPAQEHSDDDVPSSVEMDSELEADTIAIETPHAARSDEVTGPLAEPRLASVEEDPEDAFRDWVASASHGVLRRALPELEQRHEREKAFLVIQRLSQTEDGDVEYRRRYVAALQEMGRVEEAVEVSLALAGALEELGRPIQARDEYTRALSLAPGDARAQQGIERLEEAAGVAEAGDGAAPPPRAAPQPYSPAHVSTSEPTMITTHASPGNGASLDGAGRPPPQGPPGANPRPYSGVAGGAEASSDFEALLSEFRAQLHDKPVTSDSTSRTEYGASLKEMGRLDDAIRELQAAVREPSAPPLAYELLGEAFLEKGQSRIAVRLLEKALATLGQSDREMLGVLYQLGITYERLDDPSKALLCYERIFSVDIDYRDVQNRILSCSS